MSQYHTPVMLKEVLDYLKIQPGRWYIDCNLGGGGHTEGILQAGGKVLGIDLDPDAITEVARNHNLKLEKVVDGKTGYFFERQEEDAVLEALVKLDKKGYNQKECLRRAQQFSKKQFIAKLQAQLTRQLQKLLASRLSIRY